MTDAESPLPSGVAPFPAAAPWAVVLDAVSAQSSRRLSLGLLVAAAAAFVGSHLLDPGWARLGVGLMALILVAVVVVLEGAATLRRSVRRSRLALLSGVIGDDPGPCFVADLDDGTVRVLNPAARELAPSADRMADVLRPWMADPARLVDRLRTGAHQGPSLSERVGEGDTWQVAARPVAPGLALWRLDRVSFPESLHVGRVDVGPDGEVLSGDASLSRLMGAMPTRLDELVLDPPVEAGRVHRLRTPSGAVPILVAEAPGAGGVRHLHFYPWSGALPGSLDRSAIEELPVPLLRIATSGHILSANRHARALLPMQVEVGVLLSDLLEGLGRPLIEWIADVAAGRPNAGPQFLRGTGAHRDTILRVALSLGARSGTPELIAILDDVTELKALEAQFVQSQKMQALGQLAGGVAHDFNNLLTAISGHCDLLLLRHDDGDGDYADLVQIRQNVNRAASLVGQLLAFSRKQSLMPEIIDLRVALSDLTHLLNRLVGEKVRLTLDHDAALDCIRADRRQFEQVVVNLVVNARDAMPEGGEIRIETGNRELHAPLARDRVAIPPGRYVVVHVIDHGVGIPPERLPKIFEPFYTTKRLGEGTGLGLSTAYGIVKQSGGYIFADSEVGEGTIFTLWFPAHAGAPAGIAAPPRLSPSPRRRPEGRILLVEDEASVRAFAARALRLRGHEVLEAGSGEAAIEALDQTPVGVDLILSDVMLPDMDGPTWVRRAIETRPGTRVIFVSGYAEESFSEQKARIPGATFLPKPFSLMDLVAAVEQGLAEAVDPPSTNIG